MYITRKHLPRRSVLRGIGASVALPLLDAMIPAATALAKTAAKPTPRLGFIYFPHGAVMDIPGHVVPDQWTPGAEGSNFPLSPILEPLADYQKYLTVISGLGNRPAESPSVHAITPATWIAAKHIGQDTPLPSIELATEKGGIDAACDATYGCIYSSTISFRTPTMPLPMEYNPRKLFQKLFGRGDSPTERVAISHEYASVLDIVREDTVAMKAELGPADRAVFDDYLDSVREIERRIAKMEESHIVSMDLPEVPVGMPAFPEHLDLNFDLMALAYQVELTRVATFMMAAEVSSMTYPQIGVRDSFHPLSHHQNDKAKLQRLTKIQVYHSQMFAKFLKKLASTPDGDGSLLDHSILLYGSNMSDSNIHNNFPLPTAILGGGCGRIKGNQHIRYPDHTPISDVLLTILHRAGAPIEAIGDSDRELTEI
jgi:Protein of unknown function (DUF1552)